MSNHFTGLSLGPPLGDQRLDRCDLYAFQSPADPTRTVIILNANPSADGFHPDAIYRVNIDTDGDYLTDIAFSYVFSPVKDGRQTASVYMARGAEARSSEPMGIRIVSDAEVSFGAQPNIVKSGHYTFFWGTRSDAFFFDFDGIKNLFDIRGKRNFTEPHLTPGKSPWTGVDSNIEANVFSTAVELPTSEPVNDRNRWLEMFIHLMGHTGNYTREEAIAAIDAHGILPDVLSFDPRKPAQYPNGRVFTDDVIDFRLAFLTKGECPSDGLSPHTDTLNVFPYLGTPHPKKG